MNHPASKMAVGSSQSELLFQLQMAACYNGCHFQDKEMLNTIQGSAVFEFSPRHAVEHGPGLVLVFVVTGCPLSCMLRSGFEPLHVTILQSHYCLRLLPPKKEVATTALKTLQPIWSPRPRWPLHWLQDYQWLYLLWSKVVTKQLQAIASHSATGA